MFYFCESATSVVKVGAAVGVGGKTDRDVKQVVLAAFHILLLSGIETKFNTYSEMLKTERPNTELRRIPNYAEYRITLNTESRRKPNKQLFGN